MNQEISKPLRESLKQFCATLEAMKPTEPEAVSLDGLSDEARPLVQAKLEEYAKERTILAQRTVQMYN